MVIPGFQIMNGVGHLSIMADGSIRIIMVGPGFRTMSGDPPGYPGEAEVGIMAGLRWDPA